MSTYPIISADSHITEAPNTYTDYIDPAYRDVAPHIVRTDDGSDIYVVDGMRRSIPLGLVAAAGIPAEELSQTGSKFDDLHRGGWDPEARMAEGLETIGLVIGQKTCPKRFRAA